MLRVCPRALQGTEGHGRGGAGLEAERPRLQSWSGAAAPRRPSLSLGLGLLASTGGPGGQPGGGWQVSDPEPCSSPLLSPTPGRLLSHSLQNVGILNASWFHGPPLCLIAWPQRALQFQPEPLGLESKQHTDPVAAWTTGRPSCRLGPGGRSSGSRLHRPVLAFHLTCGSWDKPSSLGEPPRKWDSAAAGGGASQLSRNQGHAGAGATDHPGRAHLRAPGS